jgi:hypothetical protein
VLATQTLTIDTATTVSINSPTNDAKISDKRPIISGAAEKSATINLNINNGATVKTVTADSSGNWSYQSNQDMSDGKYSIKATSSDLYGNVAEANSTFEIVSPNASATAAAQTTTPVVGADNAITLTVKKSDGTTDTNFSGAKDVTVSGIEQAPNGTYGTYGTYGTTLDGASKVVSVSFTFEP